MSTPPQLSEDLARIGETIAKTDANLAEIKRLREGAIPDELRWLHTQATQCEAEGFTYLADALRRGLHRQVMERATFAPFRPKGVTLPAPGDETPANPVSGAVPAHPETILIRKPAPFFGLGSESS